MLKFLAHVHEIINVKAMTDYVICHLETFLYSNGSQTEPPYNVINFVFWFNEH